MDTKSLHTKHLKKMKSSKEHEVFVLPPDLLKKLGISIGNINGSQVIPDDVIGLQSTANINNEHFENIPASNCTKPSDTSILETASLMKKSVFLSPTFVSTITNAVEFSSKNITDVAVTLTDLVEPEDIVIDPEDSIETKILCDSNDIQEGDLNVDQYNITLNGEQTSQPNNDQEYPCMSLDGNKKQGVGFNMTLDVVEPSKLEKKVGNGLGDDYPFESENNVELNSTATDRDSACDSFNVNTNAITVPEASEIDIISEETIPLSKLKEIKRLQSLNGQENKPVTVQSIIDTIDFEEPSKLENDVGNGLGDDHSFESDNNVQLNSTATDRDSACDSFNVNTNAIPVPEASEIDIISEETIPLSKLKEMKRLQSLNGQQNKPVTVQSIIDTIDVKEPSKLENKVGNGLGDDQSFESEKMVALNSTATHRDSVCDSFKVNTNDIPVPEASEIDIISEETIPLSKLKEIKRLQSLNGKENEPVTVQSIIDTNIGIEKGNSGPLNIMEPNYTVPLENTEILHPGEVENANQNNLKYMDCNEQIEATAVFSVVSSKKIEETRIDITSNVVEKDISKNRTLSWESTDKVSTDFNEDNTNKIMNDCALNRQNKTLEDDGISANSVNGFDRNEEVVTIDVDKSVTKCNGQIEGCTEPAVDFNECLPSTESEHKCSRDNKEENSPLPEATGVEVHSVVEENIKQKCKNNQNRDSKNTLGSDTRVKKIIEPKSSFQNVEDKTLEHGELARILNASKKLSSAVTDIKVDKVKEIAAYLRKFSHIYTDKKKAKTALSNDIAKKETIKSNKNTIESKLCIQGVEKPGGKEVDREHTGECKVLKTYARRNPPKASKLSTLTLHKNETCDTVGELDLDLDAVNITTACETQEFCSCNDFGRLAYYDCDNLYEHIHFWHHRTANCELDVIFAIYSDEAVVSNSESGLEQEENTEENIEAPNVCWNLYESEFSDNVDNSDTQLIGRYVIDVLQDACSGDSPQVPVLNEVAPTVEDGSASKTQDEVHTNNNSNSDVILETIDHDIMVDTAESKNSANIASIEKPLNTDINDNNSAAGSKHLCTGRRPSQPKLTPSSASKTGLLEISNVLDKESKHDTDAKEKPYQRRQSSSNENKFSTKEIHLDTPKANNKTVTKRRLSGQATLGSEPSFKKSVKCALCNNIFSGAEWESHVANQHDLIAWRVGGTLNLDDPELWSKLRERLKTVGRLECSLCTMQIKKFSRFQEHIKYCIRKKLSNADKKSDKPARKSRTSLDENVTCGVCQRTMPSSKWLEHIGSLHDYLAWKQGQESLDLDNESQVWQHLQTIIRLNGYLVCYKCGLQRSRVKTYQAHIKTCDGSRVCLDESTMSVDLNSSIVPEDETVERSVQPTSVKCGVCGEKVAQSDWIVHISKEHNYLAWQEGETPLDFKEQEEVWNHLQQFIRQNGGLTCYKCGLVRKRVKVYLSHVETCDGTNRQADNSSNNMSLNTTAQSSDGWFEVPVVEGQDKKIVKCGVCSEEVPILEWLQHVRKQHDYLAWQDGARPLDVENELAVKMHLLEVSKQSGGLICNKCEKKMKYPKTYQQHTKECTGPPAPSEYLDTSAPSWIETLGNDKIKDQILTCAVCADKVESENWIKHIAGKHEYLAWVEGQPPLNLEDSVAVQKHLNDVSKVVGGLKCMKCGVKRRYVKSYLLHVNTCRGKAEPSKLSFAMMCKDVVECAVCGATVEPKHFRDHAMIEHYNIAWVVGDNPIEINNPYAVESYLKEYAQAKNRLVCKVCKISRVSYVGFYAHIIVCGKTEKETEIYKSVCDLCNNKYLRIYKSQHMTMHREQEYALERKLLVAKEKALKRVDDTQEDPGEVIIQSRRRKAAEKAKNVIEKYKSSFLDGSYNCQKCGFNTEIEKDLADHVCVVNKWGDGSDSDDSVKLENCSGNESGESDDSDVDSNVSDEEREAREEATSFKKRKHDSSSGRACRLPYHVTNVSAYMKRSTEEFIATYLTDEDLYPMWHSCEFEEVPEDELVNYVPPIEESCKVRFDENQDWVTFNRLESSRVRDTIVMFVGASIGCMSWVPPLADTARAGREGAQLCVVPHASAACDAPRHAWDATHSGRGLIQIWDCGNFITTTPKFTLGIAHDFGTVWAIDWCPSGARDAFTLEPSSGNIHRLGLMAAACSNGLAYIFVVPYPTSLPEKEKPFYKLKPVVELRLTSNENRKVYQATAIKWSVQKGHSHVVVGYADGTTAYYDLNGESPLLRTTENDRTVFYPYHDERVQNSCIEDVDMYPSGAGASARAGGVVCVASAAGAGAGPLQSHVAAAKVVYPPHWPAALLAGDDLVTQSINELELWGLGRRLGGSCGAAGCAWCARMAVAAPPLLKLLRVHPAFPDLHKQVIGRIMMIPLGAKRKRQNDELAMIVEPITYTDAVKKYGVEFKHITAIDRTTQQKLSATPRNVYPERFPLSDVTAMQFCPTFKQHHKLALAMHAGLIFIINV